MTNKESNESRRKLLKSIAAGSGAIVAGKSLPEKWTKPVVESVLLPAHAQSSPPSPTFSCSMSDPGDLEISIFGLLAGPIPYLITNTGTGPLTGGTITAVGADTGMIGAIAFDQNNPTPSDPLLPGAQHLFDLTNITATNCNIGASGLGSGTITVTFTSDQTTCQVVSNLTCEPDEPDE